MEKYKPMIYDVEQIDSIVLAQDFYKEYEFFVISLGIHPCAYVRLKQKIYDDYNDYSYKIDVHCGFTYLENTLYLGNKNRIQDKNGFLGWDYGHCGDFCAYDTDEMAEKDKLKKWTTEEMVKECKKVIDQLIELSNKKEKNI